MGTHAPCIFSLSDGYRSFPSEYIVKQQVPWLYAEYAFTADLDPTKSRFMKRPFAKRSDTKLSVKAVWIHFDRTANKRCYIPH